MMAFRRYRKFRAIYGYSRFESFMLAYEMRVLIVLGILGMLIGLLIPVTV